MKFLVTGGEQRRLAVWGEEWHVYRQAVLLRIDWESGALQRVLEYESPLDCIPGDNSAVVFKAASLHTDRLYLCTQTEVLIYEYPSLRLIHRVSLPCFNDNHHVDVIKGRLAVVSTGLDMVVFLDDRYQPVEYINVLGRKPWEKFSSSVDYRLVESTKPHDSHPNYIFEIDDEVWVTRFEQKDAVCLRDQTKRIDIGIERPHDGRVVGDHVFFTTVNGTVCVAHKHTLKIEAVYDLKQAYEQSNPLGWCRGVHVEGDRLFVGFSSLRNTKLRENLAWIKGGFKTDKDKIRAMPTRLVEYDTSTRSVLKELPLSDAKMDAVFSIHKIV